MFNVLLFLFKIKITFVWMRIRRMMELMLSMAEDDFENAFENDDVDTLDDGEDSANGMNDD